MRLHLEPFSTVMNWGWQNFLLCSLYFRTVEKYSKRTHVQCSIFFWGNGLKERQLTWITACGEGKNKEKGIYISEVYWNRELDNTGASDEHVSNTFMDQEMAFQAVHITSWNAFLHYIWFPYPAYTKGFSLQKSISVKPVTATDLLRPSWGWSGCHGRQTGCPGQMLSG